MANLNLSQFGEKLFVADADHTFIWDTAASISKRVSRNSWLNSGTLTSDAPVTISQTWNNAAALFTGLRFNAAGTSAANSAANSVLLDLQVGGATKVSINKDGAIGGYAYNGLNSSGAGVIQVASGSASYGYHMARDYCVTWGGAATLNGSIEVSLCRDGAPNTLALRNGINPQTFNVYGTYTSGSVYERMFMRYNGTDLAFQVGAETLGATARPLQLWTGGASRLHITTAGNVGIGTTAPGHKLDVVGNGRFGGDYPYIALKPNAWADAFYLQNNLNSTSGAVGVYTAFLNPAAHGFSWYQGSISRMLIDTAGNVGIGTTSPTSKLHVVGDAFLAANGSNTAPSLRIGAGANINGWYSFGGVQLNGVVNSVNVLGIASGGINVAVGNITLGNAADVVLEREAQDELALRRATNGQKFSVYGTYPGTNWERFTITAPTSGNVLLGTYIGTGGVARGMEFQTNGITRLTINSSGTSFFAGSARFDSFFYIGASNGISLQSGGTSDGILLLQNSATNNFNRIQLGGSTDSFPALKRSTTRVQAVLATTETTFTNIQGKLTTDTDYTAGSISPTGFLTLYDAQGNAYKVPCVAA